MVKPRMRSSSAPTSAFMKPSVSPVACARSTAFMGSLATRILTPRRSAFALAQAHMRKRRVGEHAIGNEAIVRVSAPSGEIVTHDAKVVLGYMREQRAAGAIAKRQTSGALVSSRSLTLTKPRSVSSTPALSSPMPAVFGMRPAATRIWLPSIVCSPKPVRSATLTAFPDCPLTLMSSAETWI